MNRGRKVREIFTVEGFYDEGSVDDWRTMISYPTMDDAIEAAKELQKEHSRKNYYKNFEAAVCFNEWEYESGDIYGNRTCLSLKDLGISKKRKK